MSRSLTGGRFPVADDMLRRALGQLDGPKLHERVTALLAASEPGRPRSALRAVLKMHEPVPGDWGTSCSCWDRNGSRRAYPCPEVTAILMALTEGGADSE
jgi:hypothetical protein